jgi:hypothetical protein
VHGTLPTHACPGMQPGTPPLSQGSVFILCGSCYCLLLAVYSEVHSNMVLQWRKNLELLVIFLGLFSFVGIIIGILCLFIS